MEKPATCASPEEGDNRVVSILIVVILPPPFEPSKPKTSPALTERVNASTAVNAPKRRVRFLISRTTSLIIPLETVSFGRGEMNGVNTPWRSSALRLKFESQIKTCSHELSIMGTNIIMKILIVLTSHSELGDTGKKTGFWVEEFAAPYYELADAGAEITLASPKGGQPPIDPSSELAAAQTKFTQRFDKDEPLKQKLAHTLKLSEAKAADYDAVFYPGGHGPLWDLVKNAKSIA